MNFFRITVIIANAVLATLGQCKHWLSLVGLMPSLVCKMTFCYGKFLAQPAKPVDTIYSLADGELPSLLHRYGRVTSPQAPRQPGREAFA